MRILFVSVNSEHANETIINYIRAMACTMDVSFFGPGYSTKEELKEGLYSFWSKGYYDAIIVDFLLAMMQTDYLEIREVYHWHRYLMSNYNIFDSIRYADAIVKDADKIEAVKIIWYWFDTFSISPEWTQCLRAFLEKDFFLLGFGEDFFCRIDDESIMKDSRLNNRYLDILHDYKRKEISIPANAVSNDELYLAPLEDRIYDWVVPGNISSFYPGREVTICNIKKAGYKIFDRFYDRAMAYAEERSRVENSLYQRDEDRYLDSRLKIRSPYLDARISRESIACWRENYSVSIRSSKIGYADGGLVKQAFRKIYEIPIRGAVLACYDVPVLSKLGFKEWENMVPVTPENVKDITDFLLKDLIKMQDIADKGRKLIFEKHTSANRVKCMMRAIESILCGTFNGSYWENGEFIISH